MIVTGWPANITSGYMKCMEINGKVIDSRDKVFGTSTEKLIFLDKAADPIKGKVVFINKCQSCHGKNGEGLWTSDKKSYTYPPLWGPHSYDDGAGMYRIINFAGFVKNNMLLMGLKRRSPNAIDC